MRFRTELIINKSDHSIAYTDGIVMLGSCFADNLGQILEKLRFQAASNPLGTFYNPVTAAYLMQAMHKPVAMGEDQLIEREGLYAHYQFHSAFNHTDPSLVLLRIRETLQKTRQKLESASFVFLTLGTAWVYQTKDTGELVANCHKQPQYLFTKRLLTQNEIVDSLVAVYNHLKSIQPNCRLVLTLSPVRHTKDGLEHNQLSKALLLTAMYEVMAAHPQITYFPAYEIVMDDLRDYRFYAEDLIHPNAMAIQYLWEKFGERYFEAPTRQIIQQVNDINAFLDHRPRVPSPAYKEHRMRIKDQIATLNPSLGQPYDLATLFEEPKTVD